MPSNSPETPQGTSLIPPEVEAAIEARLTKEIRAPAVVESAEVGECVDLGNFKYCGYQAAKDHSVYAHKGSVFIRGGKYRVVFKGKVAFYYQASDQDRVNHVDCIIIERIHGDSYYAFISQ